MQIKFILFFLYTPKYPAQYHKNTRQDNKNARLNNKNAPLSCEALMIFQPLISPDLLFYIISRLTLFAISYFIRYFLLYFRLIR